ncbi:hypothetical protein WJX72_011435 [[Myrmecia] bisecta]|uniref:SET domain-containing protein n=1 Tax=[Myrmecia] bisecta TaxID=41462 RepID=A0AAW1PCQ9_9CHLO
MLCYGGCISGAKDPALQHTPDPSVGSIGRYTACRERRIERSRLEADKKTAFGRAWVALSRSNTDRPGNEVAEVPLTSENPKGGQFVTSFTAWLQENGADLAAVDIRPCAEGSEAGLGMYATEAVDRRLQQRWWQRLWRWVGRGNPNVVLAAFPLELAVTASNICAEPELGPAYKKLLDQGVVDERQLVMLFLIVERIRGAASKWHPWIELLPQQFRSPLCFGSLELEELKGTSLHYATAARKRQLAGSWKRLGPVCNQLLEQAGVQALQPTFDDFLWANSVFWSRAQTFPSPIAGAPGGGVEVTEGIVPGLDFCNHGPDAVSRWTIWGAPSSKGASTLPSDIALVAPRSHAPKPGQEVTIDYGDKSNEELFLLHGFTLDYNPHDVLMVRCPLPPSDQWDRTLQARVELLQEKGLTPQLFLPTSAIEQTGGSNELHLSEGAWQTLEAFVMEPQHLAAELQQADGPVTRAARSEVEESGLRMAALTTLVRLLEVKAVEMEGEGGTGLLEDDIQLLETIDNDKDNVVPASTRSCIVYRARQKHLAREYLRRARIELSREMARLKGLMQAPGSAQPAGPGHGASATVPSS